MNIKNLFSKIEKKSGCDALNHSDYIDIAGGYTYINSSENNCVNGVAYNTNYVYACVKKIEQYISAIPLHLYYWTSDSTKMLTPHKIISKNFKKTIQNDPRITKKSYMEMVEIEESPEIKLLQYPAENMSYVDWIGMIASYLLLSGNALLEIIKEGDKIKFLNPLKWEHITVNIVQGRIISYTSSDPNTNIRTFTPNQVIHIRLFAPGHILLGKSNLSACIDSVQLYQYYDQYQLTLAKNYAMPGVNVNIKNKIGNEDEAKSIADKFMLKFSRCNNGKPLVTFGDIEVKPMSMAPKDMEYAEGRRAAVKAICAAFGVPFDLLDTESSNRASSQTAINQFKQITIYPLLGKILDQINSQITNIYFDSDSFIWFDPMETQDSDPVAQSAVLKTYIDSGIMTVNECRSILGMESVEQVEG
jgi:HK97 family phage portal protein